MRTLGFGLVAVGLPATLLLALPVIATGVAWGRYAEFNAFDLAWAGVALSCLSAGVTFIRGRPS